MTAKIKILAQQMTVCEVHIDIFRAKKRRFFDFLKGVSELLRSCSDNFWAENIKFWLYSQFEDDKWPKPTNQKD